MGKKERKKIALNTNEEYRDEVRDTFEPLELCVGTPTYTSSSSNRNQGAIPGAATDQIRIKEQNNHRDVIMKMSPHPTINFLQI